MGRERVPLVETAGVVDAGPERSSGIFGEVGKGGDAGGVLVFGLLLPAGFHRWDNSELCPEARDRGGFGVVRVLGARRLAGEQHKGEA